MHAAQDSRSAMKAHKLVVRLKGGLGNQMFQYAAAFGLAARCGLKLTTDTYTGFVRDRVYCRKFSLQNFHLHIRPASVLEQAPFLFERAIDKYVGSRDVLVRSRPWGLHVEERVFRYYPEIIPRPCGRNVWLDGYWQTERYFEEMGESIAEAFQVPFPEDDRFMTLAEKIDRQNAIAVGIRLYEEAPPGAHDAAPLSFYERVARDLAKDIEQPVFYLFCTVRKPIHEKLNLPGEIRYITHDDGYQGDLNRLWLLTQFRYFIISNSSFYWWAAWLAEKKRSGVKIVVCDLFPNPDTIPNRWIVRDANGLLIRQTSH
jgi:hypothetical protein